MTDQKSPYPARPADVGGTFLSDISSSDPRSPSTQSENVYSGRSVPVQPEEWQPACPGLPIPIKQRSVHSMSNISSSTLCRQMYTDHRFQLDERVGLPHSDLIESTLTDLYQITMAYGYWNAGKINDTAVFDLFFRKCPFGGEFAIAAGIEECIRFINSFKFSQENISYLKTLIPHAPDAFWTYLSNLDTSEVKAWAVQEGRAIFPKVPVMRVEGPLIICQLLETTLLNLLNYPCLVATNAARHVLAAGKGKEILEFGTRRAQGPDGAMSASRYSYLGGVHGTSNVKAAQAFNIPCKGTHAHAYVGSFSVFSDLPSRALGTDEDFVGRVLNWRQKLGAIDGVEGELVAFVSYAQAFPNGFLALIDTYDTLLSGVMNFLCVAMALDEIGYRAVGIRLDSGDLAYLSKQVRGLFTKYAQEYNAPWLAKCIIVASNDITEEVLFSLREQNHEIDSFGIGTNLVTCKTQPALGMVYKLVELNGQPRIKLSDEIEKTTIPGRKNVFRILNKNGEPIMDMMQSANDTAPKAGVRYLCHHPFDDHKRCYVTPSHVEPVLQLVWDCGKLALDHLPTIEEGRGVCVQEMERMREDHLRRDNPTKFKVSLSPQFFTFFKHMLQKTTPIKDIS